METKEFVITAQLERVAVLSKILAAFLKRHISIESLEVARTVADGGAKGAHDAHSICGVNGAHTRALRVVARTDADTVRKLAAYLGSVVDVEEVEYREK